MFQFVRRNDVFYLILWFRVENVGESCVNALDRDASRKIPIQIGVATKIVDKSYASFFGVLIAPIIMNVFFEQVEWIS